ATQALVYRVVLAVDWKQGFALATRLGGDQFARGHQAFFVREPESLSGAHGFVGRFQSRDTDDGAHHESDIAMSCDAYSAGSAVNYFDAFDSGRLESCAYLISVFFIREREHLGSPACGLLKSQFEIGPGSKGNNAKALRVRLDHAQRAATDRTGRTKNGNVSHEQKEKPQRALRSTGEMATVKPP